MVPNGWSQLKGKEITAKITKGSSPKWQGFDYQKEGTLFVTSENVRDGFLDISSPKYLPLEFNQKLKNSQLEKGDILINIVGASIGRSCQFDIENQSANINQAVCLFRTNELVKSEFIFQFLQHSTTINKLLGTQSESARPNLSLSDMRDFVFSIPPLPEQRKIAKILSTWDKAISTTERLIDNSKQQKKALMQQLLTGKKRLLDDSGKPFEGEWEEVKLGDVSDVRDGTHDSPSFIDSGYPLITSKNLLPSGKLDLNNVKFISKEDYEQINKRSNVNVGDILFGMIGTIGNPVRVSSNDYAIKNVALIKEKQSLLNSFLIFYISSLDIAKQFHRLNAGGTQKFIALGVIRNLVIRMPTHEEQLKIAAVLTNADKEIELLEQQLADLKQEKKALMQKLLTGKRRVIVDEKDVA